MQICIVLKKTQHSRNTNSQTGVTRRVTRRFHWALWLCGNVIGSLLMHCRFEFYLLRYAICGKSILVFAIHKAQHCRKTENIVKTGGEPWAMTCRVSLRFHWSLWSWRRGSNPIYCGMPLVEKSILVFANHDKSKKITDIQKAPFWMWEYILAYVVITPLSQFYILALDFYIFLEFYIYSYS